MEEYSNGMVGFLIHKTSEKKDIHGFPFCVWLKILVRHHSQQIETRDVMSQNGRTMSMKNSVSKNHGKHKTMVKMMEDGKNMRRQMAHMQEPLSDTIQH